MKLEINFKTKHFLEKLCRQITLKLSVWLRDHSVMLMRSAIVFMVVISLVWLGYEFWRLLFQQDAKGAIDLGATSY